MRFSFLYAAFIFSLFLGLVVFIFPWVTIQTPSSTSNPEHSVRSFAFRFWHDPANDPMCYQLIFADADQPTLDDLNSARKWGGWLFGLQGALWAVFILVHSKKLGHGLRFLLLIAALLIFGAIAGFVLLGHSRAHCFFGPTVINVVQVMIVPVSLAMLVVSLGLTVAGILIPNRE